MLFGIGDLGVGMRLMLGDSKGWPSLLIEADIEELCCEFDFYVVNGAWDGTYNNGYITVWYPDAPWTNVFDKMTIICDNQDRLRGSYHDVFDNFNNTHYVAPKPTALPEGLYDDDIAF
jgi:hypothetical protein